MLVLVLCLVDLYQIVTHQSPSPPPHLFFLWVLLQP